MAITALPFHPWRPEKVPPSGRRHTGPHPLLLRPGSGRNLFFWAGAPGAVESKLPVVPEVGLEEHASMVIALLPQGILVGGRNDCIAVVIVQKDKRRDTI